MNQQILYTTPGLENQLLNFVNAYGVELEVSAEQETTTLKPKAERTCRFCKAGPDAKLFKSIAHVMPELLGNHTLISDSECSKCNKHFGRYDNDLAYSLGMLPTFFGNKGKQGVPTFKSPGEIVTARSEDFFGTTASKIMRKDTSDESFTLDKETGLITLNYKKHSYRPLFVYKSLLKIALSMMPEAHLPDYQAIIDYLLLEENDELKPDSAKMMCQYLPFQYRSVHPVAVLFRKYDATANLATHVFMLTYEHISYQFPLPLHRADHQNGFKHPVVPLCPPVFSKPAVNIETYCDGFKDFSSKELLKGDSETIHMNIDPSLLNNLRSFDPKTNTYGAATLNPDDIAGFIFYDPNNPPKFPGNLSKDESQ